MPISESTVSGFCRCRSSVGRLHRPRPSRCRSPRPTSASLKSGHLAQLRRQLVAVHAGQADIDEHGLRLELARHAAGRPAVVGDLSPMAVCANQRGERQSHVRNVFDYQYVHVCPLSIHCLLYTPAAADPSPNCDTQEMGVVNRAVSASEWPSGGLWNRRDFCDGATASLRRTSRRPRLCPGEVGGGRHGHVDDRPIAELRILQRIRAIVRLAMRRPAVEHQIFARVRADSGKSTAARGCSAGNRWPRRCSASPRQRDRQAVCHFAQMTAFDWRIAPGKSGDIVRQSSAVTSTSRLIRSSPR